MTRSPDYKSDCEQISVAHLNCVIEVDAKANLVIVEPQVNMETLCRATLAHGRIPAVLPEFRAITVGGAIVGAGLESSSHRFGQISDTASWVDVLLGNGQVLRCARYSNGTLFNALPGSYGSLGLVMQVSLRLVPAASHVRLHYAIYNSVQAGLDALAALSRYNSKADFVEGLAYSNMHSLVIAGELAFDADALQQAGMKVSRVGQPRGKWFHQHAAKMAMSRTKRSKCCCGTAPYISPPASVLHGVLPDFTPSELIPIEDYLFRHDYGAFWMGSALRFADCLKQCCPMRFTAANMYHQLHATDEKDIIQDLIVQDFYVTMERAEQLIRFSARCCDVWPLWLCPVRAPTDAQPLSPSGIAPPGTMLVDVGIYGVPDMRGDISLTMLEVCVTEGEDKATTSPHLPK
eukprot:TRINITY_DN2199_c0_g1_i1.p1 TRINITY_DN2199_c0_g1~~TRINITY_DN2199_c0_g1_i1.p1  ORF type:complete len:463 (+),score=81.71 TRINITY_DN2199_c0_g1_i1:177-1391(+)